MSSSNVAIRVTDVSKCYEIYELPRDRLKQFIFPRLRRLIGKSYKKYFREFWAIKNISFEIKKGETFGIIGRNGCGKSTLLQMICGTLNPTTGSVYINGRVAALLELGSGFNNEFTGRENVYMNASVLGLSSQEIDARFNDIVAFADIGDFINQPVKTYSSGMMVRLAFAVIAHVDADILVIDEALAVGDAFFTQKCMRFLREFMKTGTVLFVSHDTAAVVNLCNAAILLNNGQIIKTGSPKNVIEKYLSTLYQENQEVYLASTVKQNYSDNVDYRDMREALINASDLRNDIEVFKFSDEKIGFGTGDVKITSVRLLDQEGVPLSWVVGGENIILEIGCVVNKKISSPIIGFQFKDKLGQVIFSDNTFLTYKDECLTANADNELMARFSFRLPVLPSGDYSISPAIATGTQEKHVQHHWLHDAMIIRVHSTSVCFGLIGIPMKNIELEIK